MARGKKKESTLTPEEKLEQALVPAEEQPYKVPENWCWTKLEFVAGGFQYGYTEKATYEEVGPHFIRITDIGDGVINADDAPYCKIEESVYPTYKINKDDIFIARMGSVGENGIALSDIDGVFASYLIRVVPKISAKYLIDYLQSPMYWEQITDKSQGTTRLNVNASVLKSLFIPLPPISEQQRIVDRIEYLFAMLDETKEKVQSVLDSFETRKAAILHKAFNGELTAKWREARTNAHHRIVDMKLNELCSKITDGFHDSPVPTESGYPYVMAGNVRETGIDYYNGLYMDEKNHRELYNKAHPEKGDILIVNIGASTGRAAIIDVDFEFSFKNCAILKLKKGQINSRYVLYYIWLRKDHLLKEVTRGGAQPFLSLKMLNGISIPVVSLDEQSEIVRILDSLFAKEQQAKEAAETVLEKIALLKKSILARAFRGELGTNDPTEESALELLKQIMK